MQSVTVDLDLNVNMNAAADTMSVRNERATL
jgi:hypothetical protein